MNNCTPCLSPTSPTKIENPSILREIKTFPLCWGDSLKNKINLPLLDHHTPVSDFKKIPKDWQMNKDGGPQTPEAVLDPYQRFSMHC